MSRAEELSQNRYPTMAEKYAFIDGYEQAEKDLANAREETIKEVCEWLDNHTILSEKWYIEDLKKHFNNMK